MNKSLKRILTALGICFLFYSFFAMFLPHLQVNGVDLSQYVETGGYVYYKLPDNPDAPDRVTLRKKLDAETAERYRELLRQIDQVRLLSKTEQRNVYQNTDGPVISFSTLPQTVWFCPGLLSIRVMPSI